MFEFCGHLVFVKVNSVYIEEAMCQINSVFTTWNMYIQVGFFQTNPIERSVAAAAYDDDMSGQCAIYYFV